MFNDDKKESVSLVGMSRCKTSPGSRHSPSLSEVRSQDCVAWQVLEGLPQRSWLQPGLAGPY